MILVDRSMPYVLKWDKYTERPHQKPPYSLQLSSPLTTSDPIELMAFHGLITVDLSGFHPRRVLPTGAFLLYTI